MKLLKRIIIVVVSLLFLLVLTAVIVFLNEIRSLASLNKVDDYPMYSMKYYGDYGFEEFLKTGANSDEDIEAYVIKRLLKGFSIDLGITGDGCTAFVTRNPEGDIIFGRNFDFEYAPSVQVFTNPDDGYASVSTVNLTFAGYSADNLPGESISINNFLMLAAPYLPFDGMNEKGVSIALLAVPEAQSSQSSDKVTLNTTTAIRLVLDRAASVEEAINLLSQYNIYFSADVPCHYLIADSTGASALVEYWGGTLQTVVSDTDYQIASNFIAYDDMNIGNGYSEFERYYAVKAFIEERNGVLSENEAISLLSNIGIYEDDIDILQWSVVYNLTELNGYIFAHRNMNNVLKFNFEHSIGHDLILLLSYPAIFIGLLLIIHRRQQVRRWKMLLDTLSSN